MVVAGQSERCERPGHQAIRMLRDARRRDGRRDGSGKLRVAAVERPENRASGPVAEAAGPLEIPAAATTKAAPGAHLHRTRPWKGSGGIEPRRAREAWGASRAPAPARSLVFSRHGLQLASASDGPLFDGAPVDGLVSDAWCQTAWCSDGLALGPLRSPGPLSRFRLVRLVRLCLQSAMSA
jgi:hypothetical protein